MSYGFGRLNNLANRCHEIAKAHGFWDEGPLGPPIVHPGLFDDTRKMLSFMMLITTEVAEAAEAIRLGDRANFEEEMADICIRVFDTSAALGLNLEQAIVDKMEANEDRPRMHGKRA